MDITRVEASKIVENRERRHFKRYDVDEVEGSLQLSTEIKVVNMSLTGLAVESGFPMPEGARCSFRIRGKDASIRMSAEVQWCRAEREERTAEGLAAPIYQLGLDFTSILGEKAQEILSFLQANIVVELDRRVFGRFQLRDEESVELSLHSGFEVRKISFSGVLVETDLVVQPEIGAVVDLEINEPNLRLVTRARIAWVGEVPGSAESRQLGLQFVDLSERNRDHLEAFIRDHLE